MKSGSSSAVAFGRVLQAVRKRSAKSQTDVAHTFNPAVSVAAVSMAEGGNRPPKTEETVRGYADALELDTDGLVELWWAMQGLVEVEDPGEERSLQRWWRELRPSPDAEIEHLLAEKAAKKERTPDHEVYAPTSAVFALTEAICEILRRLLGESWDIGHRRELGLYDIPHGRLAQVVIELRAHGDEDSGESSEPLGSFACPEPAARPISARPTERPITAALSRDVAWILSAVEGMPARERAAVAGFIHGLREGADLFSESE